MTNYTTSCIKWRHYDNYHVIMIGF